MKAENSENLMQMVLKQYIHINTLLVPIIKIIFKTPGGGGRNSCCRDRIRGKAYHMSRSYLNFPTLTAAIQALLQSFPNLWSKAGMRKLGGNTGIA